MTVPQAFRDAAYPEATDQDAVLLVMIEHPDLDTTVRLTNAAGTWSDSQETYLFSALGQTWIAAAIFPDMPGEGEEAPTGRLTMENVDQRIGEALDSISTPATVTMWAVLEASPSTIVSGPLQYLELRDVQIDAMQVVGNLVRPDLTTEPYPRNWIRPGKYVAAMRAIGR